MTSRYPGVDFDASTPEQDEALLRKLRELRKEGPHLHFMIDPTPYRRPSWLRRLFRGRRKP